MAQPRRIIASGPPVAPFASRRFATEVSPQRSAETERRSVPWMTIALLVLALVVICALWGKLPKRPRMPHEAPSGNAPGVSSLALNNSFLS